jgi:hypothetical protein
MKINEFIKEYRKYFIMILIPMFIGSIYFASFGNHPVLFLICVSPFLLFVILLSITAFTQFASLIINFFAKSFGSKVLGIIAVIVLYVIAFLVFIYSTVYR